MSKCIISYIIFKNIVIGIHITEFYHFYIKRIEHDIQCNDLFKIYLTKKWVIFIKHELQMANLPISTRYIIFYSNMKRCLLLKIKN